MNFKVLASENQIMFCKIGISIYYYAEFARETEISTYTLYMYVSCKKNNLFLAVRIIIGANTR